MITELQIERYIKQFGNRLIQDVTNKIEENGWIQSGNLLNSLEFTTETFKDRIIGSLNIAGYYQFLKENQRKINKPKTNGINVPTTGISSKSYGQKINVPDGKITWVTPLIQNDIKYFDEQLVPQIEKDIVKIIELELSKVK